MDGIPRADEEIERSILNLFAAEGAPRPANVSVHAVGGSVRLGGVVADAAEHQRVLDLVRAVPGVTGIVDEVTVLREPPPPPSRQPGTAFSKILVPLDGTAEGAEAITTALALADGLGDELSLAHVLEDGGAPTERALASTYLAGVAGELSAQGRRVRTMLREGQVAKEIVAAADELGADLIVMTTHGRHGLARAWLGSAAQGVLSASPVPVLLVRPGVRQAEQVRTLLVPVDATPGGALALAAAAGLARSLGAGIVLLQVVVPSDSADDALLGPLDELIDGLDWNAEARAAAQRYVDALAARLVHAGLVAQGRVVLGSVAPTICRVAADVGADLIVMSTHALTGPARALVGSVADEVVRAADRPVLLVKRPNRGRFDVPSRLREPQALGHAG